MMKKNKRLLFGLFEKFFISTPIKFYRYELRNKIKLEMIKTKKKKNLSYQEEPGALNYYVIFLMGLPPLKKKNHFPPPLISETHFPTHRFRK